MSRGKGLGSKSVRSIKSDPPVYFFPTLHKGDRINE